MNVKDEIQKKPEFIIGLTGPIASGKGVVAEYLKKQGFSYFSLSDLVRKEAESRGITSVTRKILQDIGDELRRKIRKEILAHKVFEEIFASAEEKVVIDGIRNHFEIYYLKSKVEKFYLIGVKTPRKIRFERVQRRGKPSDPQTWEEFLEIDARDKGVGGDDYGQNVGICLELADFVVENIDHIEDVRRKVRAILTKLES